MAGRLTISTLNDDTGVLATQNGMTGIAKAWVCFNGTNGTIRGSFNVGSITKHGTGQYTINMTTAMPNTNYALAHMPGRVAGGNTAVTACDMSSSTTRTTTAFRTEYTTTSSGSLYDPEFANIAVFA